MKSLSICLIFTVILFVGCSKPSAEEMFSKGVKAQISEQYDDALIYYQELIQTYPDSARTPEAYYAMGAIYQNHQKSFHQAIDMYRQLVEKYPTHVTSPNASFLIGFIYSNELHNIDSARISYGEFLKRYPTNQLASSAQFELSNLGKEPSEILNEQSQILSSESKVEKKIKK